MIHELTLEHWGAAGDATRERLAFELVPLLPGGFDLKRIQRFELGGQNHSVAVFSYRAAEFALVPGGIVTLGYDPATPFCPSEAQLRSWRESVKCFDQSRAESGLAPFDPSLENYIKAVSSPHRTLNLLPFLIEVSSREAGVEPISLDAPEVMKSAEQHRGEGPCNVENSKLRVHFGSDSPVAAWRIQWMNGEEALRAVQAEGSRLPTADEFEQACRAGSQELFRWGNHTPDDVEPDHLAKAPCFQIHRLPSAFGVNIASKSIRI